MPRRLRRNEWASSTNSSSRPIRSRTARTGNRSHPEKSTLQLVPMDCTTQSRGNIKVTPDHDNGQLAFRLANLTGFGVVQTTWAAAQIQASVPDELARMVCGQPGRFA